MNTGLLILVGTYLALVWHLHPRTTRKIVMTPLRIVGRIIWWILILLGIGLLLTSGPTGIIIILLIGILDEVSKPKIISV